MDISDSTPGAGTVLNPAGSSPVRVPAHGVRRAAALVAARAGVEFLPTQRLTDGRRCA